MAKTKDLIFGINPVLELLKASAPAISEILLGGSSDRPALALVRREAARRGIRLLTVENKTLEQLVNGRRHQGVVALVQSYRYVPFTDLIANVGAQSAKEKILILDGLTDPRNFGALLRTAEATGVRNVIIPKDRSVDVTATAVKASAGAVHHLNIVKVTNLRRALVDLKGHGYWVVGLDAQSKDSIYEANFPERLAILIGSEGSGVRPINLRECDFAVSIPMLGNVAALNVSVAGAVLLYELLRRTRSGGGS